MTEIIIDGSKGEGGGQILRSSLSLAALTGQTIEVHNIRAGRRKPGLLRQHLTSVKAAAKVCNAKVEGAELRSNKIRFEPGKIESGEYHFVIGSAGSTSLVCQTILPILIAADGESVVHFEGGTHNGMSPSLTFLQQSFFPVLASMGLQYQIDVKSLGFNPAGGGKWTLKVKGNPALKPFRLMEPPLPGQYKVTGILSSLPHKILEREYAQVIKTMCWNSVGYERITVEGLGPGNSLVLQANSQTHQSLFECIGEHGVRAESVAKRVCGLLKKFLASGAAVEPHLADQLLLPMLMVDGCEFVTMQLSEHTKTNIAVIKQLTGMNILCEHIKDDQYLIKME